MNRAAPKTVYLCNPANPHVSGLIAYETAPCLLDVVWSPGYRLCMGDRREGLLPLQPSETKLCALENTGWNLGGAALHMIARMRDHIERLDDGRAYAADDLAVVLRGLLCSGNGNRVLIARRSSRPSDHRSPVGRGSRSTPAAPVAHCTCAPARR
jgi:hypothetical protein